MRTATNVGISLFFSFVTFYLLYLVWKNPYRLINYLFLVLSLWINSYLYGPIRFFLILTISVLIGRLFYSLRKKLHSNRQNIAILFLIPIIGLLIFITSPFITDSFKLYFHGRGEQIFTHYAENLTLQHQGITSVIPILTKNTMDLGKLYLNIDTRSAVTDFWNPHGQMISTLLVPFFLLGVILAIRRIRKPEYFLLLLWFLTTSLPIILTNNVHIGRLIFSLPPLLIFVGLGLAQTIAFCTKIFPYKKLLYPLVVCLIVVSLFF